MKQGPMRQGFGNMPQPSLPGISDITEEFDGKAADSDALAMMEGIDKFMTNSNGSADPVEEVPARDLELAHLANDVYSGNSKEENLPRGWRPARENELRRMGLNQRDFSNSKSGFQARLYINERDRTYALAFAGTTSGQDMLQNLKQGAGLESEQFDSAINLTRRVKAHTGGKLVLTGHSLGGGLASAASLVTDTKAVTFNASGLHRNTLNRYGANSLKEYRLIKAYYVEGCILSASQDYTGIPSAAGRRIRLTPSQLNVNMVRLHQMNEPGPIDSMAQYR
jgi:hypothetical protein